MLKKQISEFFHLKPDDVLDYHIVNKFGMLLIIRARLEYFQGTCFLVKMDILHHATCTNCLGRKGINGTVEIGQLDK
jgi:hypothetical protein